MSGAFDKSRFVDDVLQGNRALGTKLITIFLRMYPDSIDQTERALANRDIKALGDAAHNLKNLVGNFCADRIWELAEQLENATRSGSLSGTGEIWQELKCRAEELHGELKELLLERSWDE